MLGCVVLLASSLAQAAEPRLEVEAGQETLSFTRDELLARPDAATIEVPPYAESQFREDFHRVTEGLTDPDLSEHLIRRSRPTVAWMRERGIRWILMHGRQSYMVGGKHRFWGGLNVEAVGGGPGLVQMLLERADAAGIEVRYAHAAHRLLQDQAGRVIGVQVRTPAGLRDFPARAVVLASGGFEANPEWRTRYLPLLG